MFHTSRHIIRNTGSAAGRYLSALSADAEHMANTANYYIRNTMTGMQKDPDQRSINEILVIYDVMRGIDMANEAADRRLPKLVRKAQQVLFERSALAAERYVRKKVLANRHFAYPTREKWFLDYGTLDAIFKAIDNPVYRRMPAQVNQNAIRKVEKSWKAYFASMKSYSRHPEAFNGRPKIPGYRHRGRGTVWFSNQTSRLSIREGRMYLSFISCREELCIGEVRGEGWKYIKAELKYISGKLTLLVTFDDGKDLPVCPEHPERIVGVDLGIGNLVAAANNFGGIPFVISGSYVKSVNQGYNRRMAELRSARMKGHDPKEFHAPPTKRMEELSRKRDSRIRDFVYKAAGYICLYAEIHRADVIVVGYNSGWKQRGEMGKQNNQNFVSVPHLKIVNILKDVAAKHGIPVVTHEESYTSRASFLDGDAVPVYEKGKGGNTFSGKRIHRGLYRSKEGILLNADINGAANIIRKAYPYAFEKTEDYSYLYRTTVGITYEGLYGHKVPEMKRHRSMRKSISAYDHHTARRERSLELRAVFREKGAAVKEEAA